MSSALPSPPDEATVAAYLGNELSEPEAEAFEIYCLDHPEFAQKVEMDLCMRRGLREIGIPAVKPPTAAPLRPLWALAAGLGAVVVCGLLIYSWSHFGGRLVAYRNPHEIPLQLRGGSPIEVTFLRLRGSAARQQIVVPGRSGLLKLRIYPDTPVGREEYSARIVLDPVATARSVNLEHLRADAEGFVELYLPLADVVGHTLNITLVTDGDPSATTGPGFQLQVLAATG